MPSVGQVAGAAAPFAGVALKLAGLSNPYSAAIAGGLTLLQLVDKIGLGRKAANKFTQNGGPQDIINRQLKTISGSAASAEEKAAATEKAWTDFLGAANQFAAANPKQATVVQQAIYKTPELTNTVQSLMGGKNPLDESFVNQAASGITQGMAGKNPGPGLGSVLAGVAGTVAPFAMDALTNAPKLGGTGYPADTGVYGPALPTGGTASSGGNILSSVLGSLGGADSSGGAAGSSGGSLLSKLLPTLVSTIPGIIGGVVQSKAIGNAANAQLAANDKSLAFLQKMYADQQANQKPWMDAGKTALTNLSTLMAPGGDLYKTFHTEAPTNAPFVAPTAEEAAQDPGWQFRLDQGMKAIERSQAKKLGMFSGAASKELQDYAQGSASQEYGSVYQRRLGENQQAYQDRVKQFELQQGQGRDVFNQNAAVAGIGQTAANVSTQAAGNFGEAAAGNATNAGNIAGASGVAQGGVLGNTLSGVGNAIQGQLTLQQLMAAMNKQQAPQNQTGYR